MQAWSLDAENIYYESEQMIDDEAHKKYRTHQLEISTCILVIMRLVVVVACFVACVALSRERKVHLPLLV